MIATNPNNGKQHKKNADMEKDFHFKRQKTFIFITHANDRYRNKVKRQGSKIRKSFILSAALVCLFLSVDAVALPTECISEAARCFQVNPLIIKAIIWEESKGVQTAHRRNKNRTEDVGLMQINSIHFKTLNGMGITKRDLKENSCVNIFSGTFLLSQAIQKKGYDWESIGSYHSNTHLYRNRYLARIFTALRNEIDRIESLQVFQTTQENIKDRFSLYCVSS